MGDIYFIVQKYNIGAIRCQLVYKPINVYIFYPSALGRYCSELVGSLSRNSNVRLSKVTASLTQQTFDLRLLQSVVHAYA